VEAKQNSAFTLVQTAVGRRQENKRKNMGYLVFSLNARQSKVEEENFCFGEVAEIHEDFCWSAKGKRRHLVWSECKGLAKIGNPERNVGSRAILICREHPKSRS
jgi:hypothetical protein